jgi:hypothetical protein
MYWCTRQHMMLAHHHTQVGCGTVQSGVKGSVRDLRLKATRHIILHEHAALTVASMLSSCIEQHAWMQNAPFSEVMRATQPPVGKELEPIQSIAYSSQTSGAWSAHYGVMHESPSTRI